MRVITAWQQISLEVTMKGYKKCCISTAMDGMNDVMLWNGSEEEGVSMRNIEGSDCKYAK